MHQGSVLCPLLFGLVMDVVPSDVRSGIPSELLYADDLVRMAPIMKRLGRCCVPAMTQIRRSGLWYRFIFYST